jgi:hypothetical protein
LPLQIWAKLLSRGPVKIIAIMIEIAGDLLFEKALT